ncbi:MAG: hypothetical protein QOF13_1003 [Solirubrobacterales bacterium]|jgi:hypothetical protein|nr:hypothetical protein [Solirubrobacterales bacterium]
MAETKTRASSSSGAKAKSKRAKPRKASASKTSMSKAAGKSRQRKQTSTNDGGQIDSARKAIGSTAKHAGSSVSEAGRNVGRVAQKAKTPLLAGGAAFAGTAGGLALGARQGRKSKALRRPKVKIRSKDLAKAARNVGQFGMEVGEVATELRRNREQANGSKRRSPVEVVLDGLTHRGNGS